MTTGTPTKPGFVITMKTMNDYVKKCAEESRDAKTLTVCPRCGKIYTRESWAQLQPASGGLCVAYDDWSDSERRDCVCGNRINIYVKRAPGR